MGKPKLICIIGRTSSGKDTLSYILSIYRNIVPLVSYTTRPKRDYEDDGEEHFFITEDEYIKEFRDLDKLAYTEINGYRYFTLYDQLTTDDAEMYSYVIDPRGYYELKREFGERIDIKSIYVKCDPKKRKWRYEQREAEVSVPFKDRNKAEDEQFKEFEETSVEDCDIVINTTNLDLLSLIYN